MNQDTIRASVLYVTKLFASVQQRTNNRSPASASTRHDSL